MKETPQEYIQRILSYVGGRDPLDIQARPQELEPLDCRNIGNSVAPAPRTGQVVLSRRSSPILPMWRSSRAGGSARFSGRRDPLTGNGSGCLVTAGHYDKRRPRNRRDPPARDDLHIGKMRAEESPR